MNGYGVARSLAPITVTVVKMGAIKLKGFTINWSPKWPGQIRVGAFAVLCASEWRVSPLQTDEGSSFGVDDTTGEEVKVVLHRVHHHRVSRVVAALQRDKNMEEREINGGLASLFGVAAGQAK